MVISENQCLEQMECCHPSTPTIRDMKILDNQTHSFFFHNKAYHLVDQDQTFWYTGEQWLATCQSNYEYCTNIVELSEWPAAVTLNILTTITALWPCMKLHYSNQIDIPTILYMWKTKYLDTHVFQGVDEVLFIVNFQLKIVWIIFPFVNIV